MMLTDWQQHMSDPLYLCCVCWVGVGWREGGVEGGWEGISWRLHQTDWSPLVMAASTRCLASIPVQTVQLPAGVPVLTPPSQILACERSTPLCTPCFILKERSTPLCTPCFILKEFPSTKHYRPLSCKCTHCITDHWVISVLSGLKTTEPLTYSVCCGPFSECTQYVRDHWVISISVLSALWATELLVYSVHYGPLRCIQCIVDHYIISILCMLGTTESLVYSMHYRPLSN